MKIRKVKRPTPRFGALVKFRMELLSEPYFETCAEKFRKTFWDAKRKKERHFVYFGEIPNQPGHCLLFEAATGKPVFFYHTEYFVELTDDET